MTLGSSSERLSRGPAAVAAFGKRLSEPLANSEQALVDGLQRLLLLSALGSLFYFVVVDYERIGWDVAGYVHAGEEIVRGRVPFVDIVDINPPLVQFLHVPPALIARWASLPQSFVFNLWVVVWAVLSTLTLDHVLQRFAPDCPSDRRFALVFGFAFSSHVAWATGHFGQREHFLVMGLVPALVLRWARHEGVAIPKLWALLVGLPAAIVLAIKPQYLGAIVLFELTLLLRHRKVSRLIGFELTAFALVGLGYAGLFLAYPGMRREFFGFYLPLIVTGYRAYDCSLRDLIAPTEFWFALGCALVGLGAARTRDLFLLRPFALFVVGALLAYLLQGKGWPYQLFPALVLAPLALVLVVPLARFVPLLVACAALVVVAEAHAARPKGGLPQEGRFWPLRSAVESTTLPGDPVLIVSTAVLGPYPLQLELQRPPGSRFAWLPMLPMFYPNGDSTDCIYKRWGEGRPAERRVLEALKQDIQRRKPVLIAAESGEAGALRTGCTPSGWLTESGLLERAMQDYEPVAPVAGFDIWQRKGAP